eukprot:NODE_353_length_8928_cov_0.455204.p8 type:complete len:116 gc:universal NODE_353_length_8928_cov_0.455204:5156-4809(-)
MLSSWETTLFGLRISKLCHFQHVTVKLANKCAIALISNIAHFDCIFRINHLNRFELFDATTYKTRKHRKLARQVNRIYQCDYMNCLKGYSQIGHLNTHRRNCQHGLPKSSKDFHF